MTRLVYLASPYTPTGDETVQDRVNAACKAAAVLMQRGDAVFCPVAHSHAVCDHLPESVRFDHEFWMCQDLAVLQHCELIVALRLSGWERSRGMARELAEAELSGIPVEWMDQ